MAKVGNKSKTQVFNHECGGKIKMITRVINHKLRHRAYCEKCGAEARKVRELVA